MTEFRIVYGQHKALRLGSLKLSCSDFDNDSFLWTASVEATMKWLSGDDDEEIEDELGRYKKELIDETTLTLQVTASKVEPDRIIKCQAETESGETTNTEIKIRIIRKFYPTTGQLIPED